MSHDALEKLIFPSKGSSASERVMPDLLHFDTEMRKPGVTRQLLWMEYKAQAGELAMGYSHFCRCYREWKKTRRLSMRQEHRAGEKLFIDFCGLTVPVVNPDILDMWHEIVLAGSAPSEQIAADLVYFKNILEPSRW